MLQVVILGSAAGGGFPQWNSNDEASRRARAAIRLPCRDPVVDRGHRRRRALGVGQRIARSPPADQRHAALHPRRGPRHSPLAAVVLTSGEVDHVAGLLTLRENHPLALYATDRVLSVLRENSIFGALDPGLVAREASRSAGASRCADRERARHRHRRRGLRGARQGCPLSRGRGGRRQFRDRAGQLGRPGDRGRRHSAASTFRVAPPHRRFADRLAGARWSCSTAPLGATTR